MLQGNLLLLRDGALEEAFRGGTASGLVFEDGAVALAAGETEGVFQSAEHSLPAFTELVASWNAATPPGTFVELSVQARTGSSWSRWFSYGKWADAGANVGSVKGQRDEKALLDVDLLRVLDGTADAIRFKLQLSWDAAAGGGSRIDAAGSRVDAAESRVNAAGPRVRLVAFTFAPVDPVIRPYIHENVALEVPRRAQLPVPDIGRIICSPVSTATVMAYYGYMETLEQAAAGAKDNGAGIYGNWSYNVAYAGERGFTAWVERCNSFEDVKDYLKRGVPVVASIRTPKDDPLPGAVMPYPAGHLLVVTGLTEEDGLQHVLVNDPAAHSEDDVPRRYPLERFLQTWRNVIYVIQR